MDNSFEQDLGLNPSSDFPTSGMVDLPDFSEFLNFDGPFMPTSNFFDEAFAHHAAEIEMAALDAQIALTEDVTTNSTTGGSAATIPDTEDSAVTIAAVHSSASSQPSEATSPNPTLTMANGAITSPANEQETCPATTPVNVKELSEPTVDVQDISPTACGVTQGSSSASPGAQEHSLDLISGPAATPQSAPDNLHVTDPNGLLNSDISPVLLDLQDIDFGTAFADLPFPITEAGLGLDEQDGLFVGLNSSPSEDFLTSLDGNTNSSTATQAPPVNSSFEALVESLGGPHAMEGPITEFRMEWFDNLPVPENQNDPLASTTNRDNTREATNKLSQALDLQTPTPIVVSSQTHDLATSTLNSPFSSPFDDSPDSTLSYAPQTTPQDAVEIDWLGLASMPFESHEFAMLGETSTVNNLAIPAPQANAMAQVPAPKIPSPKSTTAGKRKRSETDIKGPTPKHARTNSTSNSKKANYERLPLLKDSLDAETFKHMRQRSYERPQAWPLGVEKYCNPAQTSSPTMHVAVHHQQQQQFPPPPKQQQQMQHPTFMHQNTAPPAHMQGQQDLNGLGISYNNPFPPQPQQPAMRNRNPFAHKLSLANINTSPTMKPQHQQYHHYQQTANVQPMRNNTTTTTTNGRTATTTTSTTTQAHAPETVPNTQNTTITTAAATTTAPARAQAPPAPSRTTRPIPATLTSIYAQSQSRWLHRDISDPVPPPSRINRATGFDYPIPRPTGVLLMTKDYSKIADDRAAAAARSLAN